MTLDAKELELIKESFGHLRKDLDAHSTYFYESLFRHAPELRPMFREDLEGQGMKFMRTLGVIIEKLRDEETLAPQYTDLGKKHAMLGVLSSQFDPMESALIDTLRKALGDTFTPELEAAWHKAYAQVSANMIRRGGIGPG